jgi:hypothetical protein
MNIAKTTARLALLSILISSGCSKREAPQYDVGNCMAHLSEMDAETRYECIQAHTIRPRDPNHPTDKFANDPLAEFGNAMEQQMHRKPTENPEDRRLDARGIK